MRHANKKNYLPNINENGVAKTHAIKTRNDMKKSPLNERH